MSSVIVRDIIEESISQTGMVHKYYVVEEIKNRISTTEVFNRSLECNLVFTNGIESMHYGAKMIYRDAMRNLNREFSIDKEGWITAKEKLKRGRPELVVTEGMRNIAEMIGRKGLAETKRVLDEAGSQYSILHLGKIAKYFGVAVKRGRKSKVVHKYVCNQRGRWIVRNTTEKWYLGYFDSEKEAIKILDIFLQSGLPRTKDGGVEFRKRIKITNGQSLSEVVESG